MSELADEIIKQLFTDWKGKPVPRLIQEGTGGAGWSENAVRAVIKAAEHGVQSDGAYWACEKCNSIVSVNFDVCGLCKSPRR